MQDNGMHAARAMQEVRSSSIVARNGSFMDVYSTAGIIINIPSGKKPIKQCSCK
jgi:hypothetical protein